MSLAQRLVMRFAGSRASEIEQESRSWVVVCPSCGSRTSFWDLGGVRWKASSQGKKIRSTCPGCRHTGMSDVVRDPAT